VASPSRVKDRGNLDSSHVGWTPLSPIIKSIELGPDLHLDRIPEIGVLWKSVEAPSTRIACQESFGLCEDQHRKPFHTKIFRREGPPMRLSIGVSEESLWSVQNGLLESKLYYHECDSVVNHLFKTLTSHDRSNGTNSAVFWSLAVSPYCT